MAYTKLMKQIIHTTKAPAPIGPYSQAVLAGNVLYISGQIALDAETNELVTTSVQDEARQVMKNLEAVLNAADYTFENIVKTTIFLSNMDLFPQVNEVYGSYFQLDFPARETVAAAGLPKGVNVEISAIAFKPQ